MYMHHVSTRAGPFSFPLCPPLSAAVSRQPQGGVTGHDPVVCAGPGGQTASTSHQGARGGRRLLALSQLHRSDRLCQAFCPRGQAKPPERPGTKEEPRQDGGWAGQRRRGRAADRAAEVVSEELDIHHWVSHMKCLRYEPWALMPRMTLLLCSAARWRLWVILCWSYKSRIRTLWPCLHSGILPQRFWYGKSILHNILGRADAAL